MFWIPFLWHLVSWIFHSRWWVGRFHTSPFADVLKFFQSILRSLTIRKVFKWFTSCILEANHTHQGFLLCFWSGSLCMLSFSRRHFFRLLRSALSIYHLQSNKVALKLDDTVLKCNLFYFQLRRLRAMKVCNHEIMSLWVKTRIFIFFDLGGKELISSTVTTRHITALQHHEIGLRINQSPFVTFWSIKKKNQWKMWCRNFEKIKDIFSSFLYFTF